MLVLEGHVGKVHTLAFSPDGRALASVGGRSPVVWLWDLGERKPRAQLRHPRRVVCVAFAPAGRPLLATGDTRGCVTFWHPDRGRQVAEQYDPVAPWEFAPPSPGFRLAFSRDGRQLASNLRASLSWADRTDITLWAAGASGRQARATRLTSGTSCLAFSPDGEILATGSFDRTVRLHRLTPWTTLYTMQHGSHVHFLAFSPDGKTLASASPDGLIKVWGAETGRKRTTLKGQARPLHAIAYSPEGRTLASAAGDGTVCLWDVSSGRSRVAFDWGVGAVHAVAFAPDGMRAAAGGEGKIVVWDIDWDV
jgi:WD40 repeat protein